MPSPRFIRVLLDSVRPAVVVPVVPYFLLLETGDFFLLESGDKLIL